MVDRANTAPRGNVYLTGRGLAALFFFTMFQFALLDGPMWMARAGGQHGWVTLAVGALLGLPALLAILDLAARFPGKTIYQYAGDILGRPLAFAGNGLLLAYTVVFLGYFLRQFNDVVQTYLLPRTPTWAIVSLVLSGIMLVIILGPLALSRLAQMLVLPVVAASLGMLVLAMRNIQLQFLMPVWPVPWTAVAAGLTAGFIPFLPIKHLPVQLAMVHHPERQRLWVLAVYGVVALFKVAVVAASIAIFGDRATGLLSWPALEALRVVQVPLALLEELGLPGLVVYQVVLFVSSAVYFASDYIGLPVWLGLGPRVMPYLVPLLAVLAGTVALLPQDQTQLDALRHLILYGGYYAAGAYPLLLWAVARVRGLGVRSR